MARIQPVNPAEAQGKAKQLLDGVQAKLGMTPNMARTMANSPAVLDGYLSFSAALGSGALKGAFREQIALAVAQANSCEYCLSAHTAIGRMAGLDEQSIAASRKANSPDPKRAAGLEFTRNLVLERGSVSDDALARIRAAGYSEGEIVELVANVALNILTNYVNRVAGTEIDFPRVSLELAA
ncbi:MAG: carboxymuconolactone decarboxylase family protein [Bryobacterales bacterium]|nr:carboxymuconolactone decarboxylase family protein [Bryobacterales bacterium]